jgi:ubiquinone/menaquinone biosynthesis C-methylase UbiE
MRRPRRKVGDQAPATHVLRAPSEDLPFEDGTFDAVVSPLVLCGVDDQLPALRELRRVLRPGARFLVLEHLRSDDPRLPRLQDWVNWPTGSSCAATEPPHPGLHPGRPVSASPTWST